MTQREYTLNALTPDETCSWKCEHCGQTVYFMGNLGYAPAFPTCPYEECMMPTRNGLFQNYEHKEG